nr:hypothetical protein [Tanacetum cinerariifolium]
MNVQAPTTVAPLPLYALTLTPSTIATISIVPQAPTPPTTASSTLRQDLPNFGSLFGFDHRLKTLEANFSEFMQTNQFAGVVSSIPRIVQRYMDQRMNEAINVAVQIQSDRLRDEAQAENEDTPRTQYSAAGQIGGVTSEVAMLEAEQLKLATKRSLQQTYISQDSGLGSNDQDDNDAQDDDDDQDDENQDDDDQDEGYDDDNQDEGNDDDQDSNKEGEEFIHSKLSIHDEEETKDE